MSFGSRNTPNAAAANAVDASMWPGAAPSPLVPTSTPGASFSCEVLYPSPDCSKKPTLAPGQLASIISNLTALAKCMGDYIAVHSGANVSIKTCESETASMTALGTLMCDLLARIQAQFDGLNPAATTPPPTTVDPAIPSVFFGTNAVRLGEPNGWFMINGKKVPFFNP